MQRNATECNGMQRNATERFVYPLWEAIFLSKIRSIYTSYIAYSIFNHPKKQVFGDNHIFKASLKLKKVAF